MTEPGPLGRIRTRRHRRLVARRELPVGRADLPARQPAAARAAAPEHVKPRLLGHWGTTPGLNFIYAHLNRVIRERDLNVIYVAGPGHGGPGAGGQHLPGGHLQRGLPRHHPGRGRDAASCSGSSPSPAASRATSRRRRPARSTRAASSATRSSHAYGAAFDNPDLIVACVVGDGEAETGPLAASWHSNKFLNPAHDGAVLPILHLNGYKIANPTVLARIPHEELRSAAARLRLRAATRRGRRPAS